MSVKQTIENLSFDLSTTDAVIYDSVKMAMLDAATKIHGPGVYEFTSVADNPIGQVYRKYTVVDKVTIPHLQMAHSEAVITNPTVNLGDTVEVDLDVSQYGRDAFLLAKQSLTQEFQKIQNVSGYAELSKWLGKVSSATAEKTTEEGTYCTYKGFQAILPTSDSLFGDSFRYGERVYAYAKEIVIGKKGNPIMVLSRTHTDFIPKLYARVAPLLASGVVKVHSIARVPGFVSMMVVYSTDIKVDPIKALLGPWKVYPQTLAKIMCSPEYVALVPYSHDPLDMIASGLNDVYIREAKVIEAEKKIKITIGHKAGRRELENAQNNAALISQLIGYTIDVDIDREYAYKRKHGIYLFTTMLGLSDETAEKLVFTNVFTIEELAECKPKKLLLKTKMPLNILESCKLKAQIFLEKASAKP